MKKNSPGVRPVFAALLALMIALALPSLALAYDAAQAGAWLDRFAAALTSFQPLNLPKDTADPARAGQVLIEYPFGTVTATAMENPSAAQITAIDVRTAQVTDCRGVKVGMSLADALGAKAVGESSTQLYVFDMQADGCGWAWAYVSGADVYGVEYISYALDAQPAMEYTLTYVIEQGVISAIRMRMAESSQAQAMDGMNTAREIAARQKLEVIVRANTAPILAEDDLQVSGVRALGADVASVAGRLGEPLEIQTLPEGTGRILVYDGAAVTLGFDEYTGVERVRGVSVSTADLSGPRGLTVGMTAQQAAALFACEQDVTALGGALYIAGEAMGEAPCGDMIVRGDEAVLRYACLTAAGTQAVLEAGTADGVVTYWRMVETMPGEAEGGV